MCIYVDIWRNHEINNSKVYIHIYLHIFLPFHQHYTYTQIWTSPYISIYKSFVDIEVEIDLSRCEACTNLSWGAGPWMPVA